MAEVSWRELEQELSRRPVAFWWRDDDAMEASPALERLLDLSQRRRVPLALAVVPDGAQAGLFRMLHAHVTVLQHGTDHRNRAESGGKKTEYPQGEPVDTALARISAGMERLRGAAGKNLLPVLAPPWNRIGNDVVKKLPSIGITGLSTYGARASAEPVPGLRQVNTHVDIVAWRRGRRFIGEEAAFASLARALSRDEPIGWLTHHAVHDEAAWDFLERLFTVKGARWLSAAEAFSYTRPAHG
jgi:hypothetical protein